MFGQGYRPLRSLQLEDGEYTFTIKNAEGKYDKNGLPYIEVQLEADGKPGYSPNRLFFSDRPRLDSFKPNGKPVGQQDLDRWDRSLTAFFNCFSIREGDFNTANWRGHRGICKVEPQYDPNEPDKKSKRYKEIVPQMPAEASRQPSHTAENDFPEDIPF